jgi:hypothetical protein
VRWEATEEKRELLSEGATLTDFYFKWITLAYVFTINSKLTKENQFR